MTIHEINTAFTKLTDELSGLNGIVLSIHVCGSYITDEFKPWISDIDLLLIHRENKTQRIMKIEIQEVFEKYTYLDSKMRFHTHLFDPWIYSEKEIIKLPLKRMLTYTIPLIKNNYRTIYGMDLIQKIPNPDRIEIVESYLTTLKEMSSWLESHRPLLDNHRLDLVMKSIVLRTFNALRGYLAVKGVIETNRRKAVDRFIKLMPGPHTEFINNILTTYENWTKNFPKNLVIQYYELCLNLMKCLYDEVPCEIKNVNVKWGSE